MTKQAWRPAWGHEEGCCGDGVRAEEGGLKIRLEDALQRAVTGPGLARLLR